MCWVVRIWIWTLGFASSFVCLIYVGYLINKHVSFNLHVQLTKNMLTSCLLPPSPSTSYPHITWSIFAFSLKLWQSTLIPFHSYNVKYSSTYFIYKTTSFLHYIVMSLLTVNTISCYLILLFFSLNSVIFLTWCSPRQLTHPTSANKLSYNTAACDGQRVANWFCKSVFAGNDHRAVAEIGPKLTIPWANTSWIADYGY